MIIAVFALPHYRK